jgi:hypothetical protein
MFTSVITSGFDRWAQKAFLFLLALNLLAAVVLIAKVDRNYDGNPTGGGRQLLCVVAKNSPTRTPTDVRTIRANCP